MFGTFFPALRSMNDVIRYLEKLDPERLKVRVLGDRINMHYVLNGKTVGELTLHVPTNKKNARINSGETNNRYRSRGIGTNMRAIATKAIINKGKYNRLHRIGVTFENRKGSNKRPPSTWIVQERLGFHPLNRVHSVFRRKENSLNRVNQIVAAYLRLALLSRRHRPEHEITVAKDRRVRAWR
jgi:hypothetical protein